MIRRLNVYGFYLSIVTGVLPLLAYFAAWYARLLRPVRRMYLDPAIHTQFAVLTTIVWMVMAQHYGVISAAKLLSCRPGTRSAVMACLVTYSAVFATAFFHRSSTYSRSVVLLSAGILFLLTITTQAAFRTVAFLRLRRHKLRIAVIGVDRSARRTVARLQRASGKGCEIVGHVAVSNEPVEVRGPICTLEDVAQLRRQGAIDDVVIAISPALYARVPQLVTRLESLCLPARAVFDIGNIPVREKLSHLGNVNIIDLGNCPADKIEYIVLKRAFDILFSIVAIMVATPLMIIIAAAIKLSSPGPVLFMQSRVGFDGKVFSMYKFRTMRVAESAQSDTTWTTQNDSRRTWIGTFLRRSSLDELPQFFNVLRGDMSVVGPRPERPHFAQKFLSEIEQYDSRHRLKVGITGWAQVNGLRGDTSIRSRLEYDLYYIRNWSLLLDLRIVLRTITAGMFAGNAY
jgi:Undecaprenyl-phosphate glucose phosphotransferase